MDIFTFVVAIMIMVVAMQYKLYWLMALIGGVIIYMGKDTKTFIIVLAIIFLLYVVSGTSYEQYSIYIAALGVVVYLFLNRSGGGGEEGGSFNPNDQYADLLKGLGG